MLAQSKVLAMIEFTLPIEPQPKLRPRFFMANGKIRSYSPAKTAAYENMLLLLANKYRPQFPLKGLLRLSLEFMLTKPKSSKNTFPVVKPDLDNLVKAVADSFNGIFWVDDSQIVALVAGKRYALNPGITIRILDAKDPDEIACW